MATLGESLHRMWSQVSPALSDGRVKIALIVLAVTVLWLLLSSSRPKSRLPRPPGHGLPLIRESIQYPLFMKTDEFCREWFQERAKKYGQLFRSHILGSPIVIMDAPAGHKFLFQNEGKVHENEWPAPARRILGPDSLTTIIGEQHKNGRRIFGGFLNHAAVTRYMDFLNEKTAEHFENYWGKKEVVGAFAAAKEYTFGIICKLLMSLDAGPERDELLKQYTIFGLGFLCFPINLPGFQFYYAMKSREYILNMLEEMMAERRKLIAEGRLPEKYKNDVLHSLMTVPDDSGKLMSDPWIKDNMLLLLFGGFDTTSTTLAMINHYIARNPHVYEQLFQEHKSIIERKRERGEKDAVTQEDLVSMKYTWKVIQETLRLQPPVAATFRRVTKDFEYNGYLIPKGWKLMWTSQISHYDPRFFKDPLTFDPSRWDEPPPLNTFIPFGGGPRMCPGYEFARTQMHVWLHHLVRRYRWTPVYPNEKVFREPMPAGEFKSPVRITRNPPI